MDPSSTDDFDLPAAEISLRRPLAPALHTLVLVIVMMLASWRSTGIAASANMQNHSHSPEYILNAAAELFLTAFVWFGLRLRKTPFREVIGHRWEKLDDFMVDVAIAATFWIVSLLALAGVRYAMGMLSPASAQKQLDNLQFLVPHGTIELVLFVLMSVVAGFCEEIIFRGYLQKQFAAWFGGLPAGVIVSALVFGAAHGYQGVKMMLVIAMYGALFGALAAVRGSIIPGIIAHAWQDSITGIVLSFLQKHPGLVPIR